MKAKILTIVAGALAGGFVSLTTQWWIGCWRRWRLHKRLCIYRSEAHSDATQTSIVTVRVHNRHVFPLKNCWGYLSLNYDMNGDILHPPVGRDAHIKPRAPFPLRDD